MYIIRHLFNPKQHYPNDPITTPYQTHTIPNTHCVNLPTNHLPTNLRNQSRIWNQQIQKMPRKTGITDKLQLNHKPRQSKTIRETITNALTCTTKYPK